MKLYSYVTMLGENGIPYLEKKDSFKVDGRWTYNNPDRIVEFIKESIGIQNYAEEYGYCICLDTANHINGLFEIGHGSVDKCIIGPREVFQKALMIGAVSIILTHNHPSGNTEPSKIDIELTNNVRKAGELLGINLLDHIIVSKVSTYSFMEHGLI